MTYREFYLASPRFGRLQGTKCPTFASAKMLLGDRRENGHSFPGEHIVSVRVSCSCRSRDCETIDGYSRREVRV